jgi:hypothetical protein
VSLSPASHILQFGDASVCSDGELLLRVSKHVIFLGLLLVREASFGTVWVPRGVCSSRSRALSKWHRPGVFANSRERKEIGQIPIIEASHYLEYLT